MLETFTHAFYLETFTGPVDGSSNDSTLCAPLTFTGPVDGSSNDSSYNLFKTLASRRFFVVV